MAHAAYCRNGHTVGIKPSSRTASALRHYLEADGREFPAFCPQCGEVTIGRCPNPDCGKMIEPNAIYCEHCGLPFPWTKEKVLDTGVSKTVVAETPAEAAPIPPSLWRERLRGVGRWLWSALLSPVAAEKGRQEISAALMWCVDHLKKLWN